MAQAADRRQRRKAQSRTDRQKRLRAKRAKGAVAARRGAAKRRTRSRTTALILALTLSVVVVAGLAIGAIAGLSGPHHAPHPHLTARPLLRPPAASALVTVPGRHWAWVTDDLTGKLVRYDTTTGRAVASVHVAGRPDAMVATGRDLWVAEMVTNTVDEYAAGVGSSRPGALRLLRSVPVPVGPAGLAVLDGRIWVASVIAGEVTPLSPTSGRVGRPVVIPGGAVRIAAGYGDLWVTGTNDTLVELHPRGGPESTSGAVVVRSVKVGGVPIGVATGAGSVWVANSASNSVTRVAPATGRVTQTLAAGTDPLAVAVSGGRVWVADATSGQVRTVYPTPASRPLAVTGTTRGLLTVGSGVWVTTANPGAVMALSVAAG